MIILTSQIQVSCATSTIMFATGIQTSGATTTVEERVAADEAMKSVAVGSV